MNHFRMALFASLTMAVIGQAYAGSDHEHSTAVGQQAEAPIKGAAKPHFRTQRAVDADRKPFDLPSREEQQLVTSKLQKSTMSKSALTLNAAEDCNAIEGFRSRSGATLANYIAGLPNVQCTYGLFSINSSDGNIIYSAGNMRAVTDLLNQLAPSYQANSRNVANLVLYLRAGYYLAYGQVIPQPAADITASSVSAVEKLIDNPSLFNENSLASSTANETMILITNLQKEMHFIPRMKTLVQRFTNTSAQPTAADKLKQYTASSGFTGVLTVFYRAHFRYGENASMQTDASLPTTLSNFVTNNRSALEGSSVAYQLTDAANEAYRFLQYSSQKPTVKPLVKSMLNQTSLNGPGADLWLAAASAVKYYDNANCAEYGVCNLEETVANAILTINHTCSSTIRLRVQQMSTAELQDSCVKLQAQETFFHQMFPNNQQPVADDYNSQLEVVVFDDYTNYDRFAGIIYGISTDNGGMYLEGNPAQQGNQARFIAHEASWLRPDFVIWNLEHEYVHYLDGRFNLYGDFSASVAKPTVWWIEGVGEYLSKKNNYQEAIDEAKTGKYTLSTIFGNSYSMSDYVARAYRWGYMAVRFMNEKHRGDIDAMLQLWRQGDYNGYQAYINNIGTQYNSEFASWVQTATTGGTPPMPGGTDALISGQSVNVSGAKGEWKHFYIDVPRNTSRLDIASSGGTGDADLYVKFASQPTLTSYDKRPYLGGNNESAFYTNPPAGRYYVSLHAYAAFQNAALKATVTPGGGSGACERNDRLENGCTISGLSSSSNAYVTMWVPSGARNLVISTSGGTGNANLYVKAGGWPSTSNYHWASTNSGNSESVSVASPTGGQRYYITLNAAQPFSGLSITARFDP